MKPVLSREDALGDKVAPHAGAWIETSPGRRRLVAVFVAPHAGAWIETH